LILATEESEMNKRVISKVGKRNRPDIDMMEYIQTTESQEFDLDRDLFRDLGVTPIKKKLIKDVVELDIDQNAEFSEIIED
jgi:5'(3')-deoxyribonucleotidase